MPSFISFIPTPPDHIQGFLELAELSRSDVVYDLGSGDGRLLFAALRAGAGKAVGVELEHELVRKAREEVKNLWLEDRITFIEGDVLQANLADATVVFCYLITQASVALRPKFEAELKPGTKVIMESFPVPGWKAVKVLQKDYYKQFYLYIMPPIITGEIYPDGNADIYLYGTD